MHQLVQLIEDYERGKNSRCFLTECVQDPISFIFIPLVEDLMGRDKRLGINTFIANCLADTE